MRAKMTTWIFLFATSLIAAGIIVCVLTRRNHVEGLSTVMMTSENVNLPLPVRDAFDVMAGAEMFSTKQTSAYNKLRKEINLLAGGENKRLSAKMCARLFLGFNWDVSTQEKLKTFSNEYVNFANGMDVILCEAGVDGVDRVEFFMSSLLIFRKICCGPIPNEDAIEDFEVWDNWAGSVYSARGTLIRELTKVEKQLFRLYLTGLIDKDEKYAVRRIVDFHVETIREVKRMDAYQRSHKRSSPNSGGIVSSRLVKYSGSVRDFPDVIQIGTNEIDIAKWVNKED